MADILRIPQVWTHEVANGGAFTGVAPDGVDTEETLYRGRYRKWAAGTVGGLFTLPAATFRAGWALDRVVWNATGIGAVTVNLIDDDAFVYPLVTVAAASGTWVPPDSGGLLVIPGWSLQVVGVNPLGADGRVVVVTTRGWNQELYDTIPLLGREQDDVPKRGY